MFRPDAGRKPEVARQRQAIPAQVRCGHGRGTSRPTPTGSTPSMRALASCPSSREATGPPRRPSGPTGCRARPRRRAIRRTVRKSRRAARRSGNAKSNLTTQASRNGLHVRAWMPRRARPTCAANALLSATPFNTTTLNPDGRGYAAGVQLSGGLDGADVRIHRYRQSDRVGPRHRQSRQRVGARRHDDRTAFHPWRRAAFAPGRPQLWRIAASRRRVLRLQRRHAARDRGQADRHRRGQRTLGVRRSGSIVAS